MNTAYPVADKVLARISRMGRGVVFSGVDVLDVASWPAVRQALARLARAGVIRRIGTALYHYPRINPKLGGDVPPSMDAVARAIARRTDSRIVASGVLALNMLGLSTQVPAKVVYLTNGPSRNIAVGPQTLVFRHVAPRRMSAKGSISPIVFEAFRYLRQDGIDADVIARLRRTLSPKAKAELKRALPRATLWMRPYVLRILSGKVT